MTDNIIINKIYIVISLQYAHSPIPITRAAQKEFANLDIRKYKNNQ